MEAHEPQDGEELVERVRNGDGAAFRELVEVFHARVFRLVFGVVDDWQTAEDVAQEVFVSVFLKLSSFRGQSKFSTWLYRVAVNAALKARRRGRRLGSRIAPIDETLEIEIHRDDDPDTLERGEILGKLLRPLPEHLRTVILLKEREGLSYKEMAQVLGCSTGAVEQRIHRAFEKLRAIWKDRHDELGVER